MHARVTATAEALELIERLRARHGRLVFFQSGGCCAGSSPMCLPEGDLLPGTRDLHLGEIGDSPVYVDGDHFARWGEPELVIDVGEGGSDTFSLEGPRGLHFVSAARVDARAPARHNDGS